MKRLKTILGNLGRSPLWLPGCITIPILVVAFIVSMTFTQAHVFANRPEPALQTTNPKTPKGPQMPMSVGERANDNAVVVGGSLNGTVKPRERLPWSNPF